jgi:hypothetical protein
MTAESSDGDDDPGDPTVEIELADGALADAAAGRRLQRTVIERPHFCSDYIREGNSMPYFTLQDLPQSIAISR